MKAIVVVDKNWGIGKDGDLLVHLPGDLKYFKDKTIGKVVVMGRKTLVSLPGGKPLPGRTNIVLSRSLGCRDDCIVCNSMDRLFDEMKEVDRNDVYIIGGESVYRELLPFCDTIYVTKISIAFQADKFFVNLDNNDEWKMVFEGEPQIENDICYRFTEYKRF